MRIITPEIADARPAHVLAPSASARAGGRTTDTATFGGAEDVLGFFVGGARLREETARAQTICILRDLGHSLVRLRKHVRGKEIVRFYDDPWELCVERTGSSAALSVYRAGTTPQVAVYDRPYEMRDVVAAAAESIRKASYENHADAASGELGRLAKDLEETDGEDLKGPLAVGTTRLAFDPERDAPLSFGTEFHVREAAGTKADARVERSDLHALLFRGRLRADIRGRTVELSGVHPFLVAERFVEMSRQALDGWERGVTWNSRCEAGGLVIGIRLGVDDRAALTLGTLGASGAIYTFPSLGVTDIVEAVLAFGRALVRCILRHDRGQSANLRLSAFRRAVRETGDALREVSREDTHVNESPESYREFAHTPMPSPARTEPPIAKTRLRYAVRWRAAVPGIDLRSTFLCGDRMVVGAQDETFCLDRATGTVLWRIAAPRAMSVVTAAGLARIAADGSLTIYDLRDGKPHLSTKLTPRTGGPLAAMSLQLPNQPRLLVATEGEHHLAAIDVMSGERRWRYAWGPTATLAGGRTALRIKRSGKLLYLTSGDSALTAIDALTGALVWRLRDRLRFRNTPAVTSDHLFAVAGGVHSRARLHAIDPYSGTAQWSQPIGASQPMCTVEGPALVSRNTVAVLVRERSGVRLEAFDRQTGAPRWVSPAPVAPVGSSWLAIDGAFVANCPDGKLVAVAGDTGALLYSVALNTKPLDDDLPRRLEPILRGGALFVPSMDVHVIRPSDGAHLGTIAPTDTIPDLLRVDEKCDVYVAEESGHLASFSALPRLSIVR